MLEGAEIRADVTLTVKAHEIAHRSAADRSFESVGVANHPAGHEATIAITGHEQPLRIRETPFDEVAYAEHQVFIVLATPVAHTGVCKRFAVAAASPRIDEQHGVSPCGELLVSRLEGAAMHTMRASMDFEHQRIAIPFAVAGGLDQEGR